MKKTFNQRSKLGLLLMSTALAGCQTSLQSRVENANFSEAPTASLTEIQDGIPYQLAKREVDLSLTRYVSRCEYWDVTYSAKDQIKTVTNDKDEYVVIAKSASAGDSLIRTKKLDASKYRAPTVEELKRAPVGRIFQVKPIAKYSSEIIGDELYSIDTATLVDAFKTSNVKTSYHKDTLILSEINANIEGKEAEATAAGLKLAASVASIALGIPPSLVVGNAGNTGVAKSYPQTESLKLCKDDISKQALLLESVTKRLKSNTVNAAKLAEDVSYLTTRQEAANADAADLAALRKKKVEAKKLTAAIQKDSKARTRLLKALGLTQELRPLEMLGDDGLYKSSIADADLKKWLEQIWSEEFNAEFRVLDCQGRSRTNPICKKLSKLTMYVAVKPLAGSPSCDSGCNNQTIADVKKLGIVYRIPARSLLLVTKEDPTSRLKDASATRKQEEDLIFETVTLPQFGPRRHLPLKSNWGEKVSLTATFGKDGTPTSIAYTSYVAAGVTALSTAQEAAATALSLKQQADSKVVTDEQAEIDSLTRQIDLLKKTNDLEAMTTPASPEIVDIEAHLAVRRLEKELSDLDAAIRTNNLPDGG